MTNYLSANGEDRATCSEIMYMCVGSAHADQVQAQCPYTCGVCPESPCVDVKAEQTGYTMSGGDSAQCADLVDLCTDSEAGEKAIEGKAGQHVSGLATGS